MIGARLPPELLYHVVPFLDFSTLLTVRLVDKRMMRHVQHFVSREPIWVVTVGCGFSTDKLSNKARLSCGVDEDASAATRPFAVLVFSGNAKCMEKMRIASRHFSKMFALLDIYQSDERILGNITRCRLEEVPYKSNGRCFRGFGPFANHAWYLREQAGSINKRLQCIRHEALTKLEKLDKIRLEHGSKAWMAAFSRQSCYR